jgi:NADP-dependent 3-hydroxy acid dehydrogenase YdfG
MPSIKGKVVIVTGASSGFGAAAARLFAKEGCKVVLAARRIERLEELAKEIRRAGGEALPIAMDVSQPGQIEAMVKTALEAYGQIDILYNNAGFGRLDWLENLDPVRDIQAQITVDLLGAIWVARAVVPHMYRRGAGTIINMCSMAGWVAPPLYSVYSAAKFGMRGFTEALRREAMSFGVKVCIICPSGASTEFGAHVGPSQTKQRFSTPDWLKLTAEDVARSVVGLAKWPRREVVAPWWMTFSKFLNSHFNGFSDSVQASVFKSHHQI